MGYEEKTDQELYDTIDDAKAELARRQTVETVNEQVAEVLRTSRASGAITTPEVGAQWVQPTDATTAYMAGDVTTDGGKTWVSTVNYNVWRPGESGWREQTEDGSPAEYLSPTGSHDAYNTDDLVTFEGEVYRSTIDNNIWSPVEYPQGWEKQ